MIVVAPGKKKGAISPRLVEFVDIYPTLAELCGLPAPQGLEGTSFAPLLSDPLLPWKKAVFVDVLHPPVIGRNVRTDRYSYTEWGDEKTAELYDHANDPKEYTNLAKDPKHAKIVAEMGQLLKAGWQNALPPTAARSKL